MLETDRNNIDLYRFDACQLAYNNGTIGMIITRQMTLASDNLNHQGAYATIYDAETLKPVRKIGGTTGHCFGLTIMSNNFKPNSYLAI